MPLVTDQQFVTLDHNGKHNNQPSEYTSSCMYMYVQKENFISKFHCISIAKKRVLNFMDENIYWWQIGNEE